MGIAYLPPSHCAYQNRQNGPPTAAGDVPHGICMARLSNVCLRVVQDKAGLQTWYLSSLRWEKGKHGNVGYHILACQFDLTEQCCKGNGVHSLLWHMFNMDHCAEWWGCEWYLFYEILWNSGNLLKAVTITCWSFFFFPWELTLRDCETSLIC